MTDEKDDEICWIFWVLATSLRTIPWESATIQLVLL